MKTIILATICFGVGHHYGSLSMLTIHGDEIEQLREGCFEPLDSIRVWKDMVLNDWRCEERLPKK
jgi:hypothetical protein